MAHGASTPTAGMSYEWLKTVWALSTALGPLRALNDGLSGYGGFKKVWRDFIAANWNQEPMMPKVPVLQPTMATTTT